MHFDQIILCQGLYSQVKSDYMLSESIGFPIGLLIHVIIYLISFARL